MPEVRLSEVIGSLSAALDITGGQPPGHARRTCLIGMRLAETVGLDEAQRSSLFYALLLKDAGCSSNASRVATLYGADDREVKFDHRGTDQHRPVEAVRHLVRSVAPGRTLLAKGRQLLQLARFGSEGARALYELRCERGADIARMIDLDEDSAQAIRSLDEHWDGRGVPSGLAGEEIPLLGRILCLAQTVEVHLARDGMEAALAVAAARRGTWFDPTLVDALRSLRADRSLWAALARGDEVAELALREPADRVASADDRRLDRIADAFGRVIDAKSPWTARHSEGVARIAVDVGRELGFGPGELRDLRRAGLLHDIGKLGVSNTILDKPGRLDEAEWQAMRRHPALTYRILRPMAAFASIAGDAAAHHERLDGGGYHLGLGADQLSPAARALAVADVCEALSADRPYRPALAPDEVLAIMRRDAGRALCPTAFAALEATFAVPAPALAPVPLAA